MKTTLPLLFDPSVSFSFLRSRCAILALATLTGLAAAISARAAVEDEVIFSEDGGFREKWVATTWGKGLEVRDDAGGEKDGKAVAAIPSEGAEPFGGLSLRVGYDQKPAVASIPLDDAMREYGVVVLRVNCGKDVTGQPSAGQAIQVTLGFLVNGNLKEVAPVALSKFGRKAALDGDSESWEEIRIPIADMLEKLPDPSAAVGLMTVGIQYVDTPTCELLVSDCRLKSE